MTKIVLAFDLYGTLLSTESIAKKLASHFGEDKAASIAGVWRKYQLEYTWRLNSMSRSIVLLCYRAYLTFTAVQNNINTFPKSPETRFIMLLPNMV